MRPIYLDHAAATPLDERVLAAMQPYFAEQFYNPSALYSAGVDVRAALEAARSRIARVLGAKPAEIIFTAGGTEANNLAIYGVMNGVRRDYPHANMVVSAIEHDSVLASAVRYDARLAGVDGQGMIGVEDVRAQIDDNTALVSIMYANNEVGTIQPLRQIGQLVTAVRRERRERGVPMPLYLHSDAAQAANYLDLQVARLGVDLLTLNGGKLYGPKQSGVLYVRGGLRLDPLIRGGGQERGLRSGTENVPAAIGLAAALDIAQQMRHGEARRLAELQAYFFERLQVDLPTVATNGSRRSRLPNNLHLTLPGLDNERVLFQMDAAGIMAAAGSACAASSEEPSHVLAALGMDAADIRSSLRLTMGRDTTRQQLDRTLQVLADIVAGR